MSERFENLSYFLSSAPFYVHSLEKQSMECRFWQAEVLYGPEYNPQFKKRGKENGKLLGAIGEIGNDVLYQSCLHLQETHFSSGDYRLNFQRESWKVCAETLSRSNRIYACTSHSLLWKSGLTSRNAKLCQKCMPGRNIIDL